MELSKLRINILFCYSEILYLPTLMNPDLMIVVNSHHVEVSLETDSCFSTG